MLNKIVFLMCVFFSVVSKANLLDSRTDLNDSCRISFTSPVSSPSPSIPTTDVPTLKTQASSNETTSLVANVPTLKTQTPSEYWSTYLENTAFNVIHFKQNFPQRWKQVLLENLPILDTPQILKLVGYINKLKNEHDIFFEESFFQPLIVRITSIIPELNKKELMDILYDFVSIELIVTDSFVQAWRNRTLELKKSFSSHDRYYLTSLFRQLGIPSLKNPYDLNSGDMLEVPIEATRNTQP